MLMANELPLRQGFAPGENACTAQKSPHCVGPPSPTGIYTVFLFELRQLKAALSLISSSMCSTPRRLYPCIQIKSGLSKRPKIKMSTTGLPSKTAESLAPQGFQLFSFLQKNQQFHLIFTGFGSSSTAHSLKAAYAFSSSFCAHSSYTSLDSLVPRDAYACAAAP